MAINPSRGLTFVLDENLGTNVLDILRSGIESALLGLGHASIHDLTADDVIIPSGFTRPLGA